MVLTDYFDLWWSKWRMIILVVILINYISIHGFLNNNFISSNHWMLNESNKNNQSSVHDFVI